jgi:hypothetical protein
MQLTWHNVESSNIESLAYENGRLYARFLQGGIYEYENVPEVIFTELLGAESVGKAFHRLIRKSSEPFPYRKLSLEQSE